MKTGHSHLLYERFRCPATRTSAPTSNAPIVNGRESGDFVVGSRVAVVVGIVVRFVVAVVVGAGLRVTYKSMI